MAGDSRGAPPGGGCGPAGFGGERAPARVVVAAHRARHAGAVAVPRAFRESQGWTFSWRSAPAKHELGTLRSTPSSFYAPLSRGNGISWVSELTLRSED